MFNIPNLLSAARLPLALLFLSESIPLRALALVLAMASDFLDGFLARRYLLTTRIGTFLDPLMDKFFVIFVLSVMIAENRITVFEAASFICRDFSVFLFGCYLIARGYFAKYQFRAIWCGKVTTALQFAVLLALTCGYSVPLFVFSLFVALGLLALIELYLSPHIVENS